MTVPIATVGSAQDIGVPPCTSGDMPPQTDLDCHGLGDLDEVTFYDTSPIEADTDDDGLIDGDEVNTHGTDPHNPDTDGDGVIDGDDPYPLVPNPVSIAAGRLHTCAILFDGTRKCCGYNGYGQLGGGTYTNSNTPVTVTGLSDAATISARYFHTCALLADGTAKCWGYNNEEQLGDGTTTNGDAPVTVAFQ